MNLGIILAWSIDLSRRYIGMLGQDSCGRWGHAVAGGRGPALCGLAVRKYASYVKL